MLAEFKIDGFLYRDGNKEEYINFEAYKYRISCMPIMIIRLRSLKLVVTFLLCRPLNHALRAPNRYAQGL